jgi:periplasmic protein TonB
MFSLGLNTFAVFLGSLLSLGGLFVYARYAKLHGSLSLAKATSRRTKTIESETINKTPRHFLLGFLATSFIVFLLFNWTFYNKIEDDLEDFFLNEELTITLPKTSAEPPPPASEAIAEEAPKETPVEPVPQKVEVKIEETPIEKIEQPQTPSKTTAEVTSNSSTNTNSTSTDLNGKGPVSNPFGEEAVFVTAEQMPRFPGCDNFPGDEKVKQTCSKDKLKDYIMKNLSYPPEARINKIEGTVYVKFIVDKYGNITNVSLVKDPGYGLGDAAKKLIENMNRLPQKWTPASQNGKPIRVGYTFPVLFKLDKTNSILK